MAGGSSNKPSKALPNKKKNARFGKARPVKGSGSGSQNNPQRTRFHAIVHGRGLVVLTALKEATNTQSFTGDLTKAIVTVTVFITIHIRNCTDLIIWCTNENKIYKTDLRYEFAVFRSWK